MPVLNVESLDDPLLFDATGSFSGGMDSVAAPRLLSDVTSSELINVDIDRTGTAITRRGTASVSSTALAEGTATIQGLDSNLGPSSSGSWNSRSKFASNSLNLTKKN